MRSDNTTHRRRLTRCVGLLATTVVLALAAAPTAHAQSQGQLYAAITDANGAPVEGLTAESFQIQEDGVNMTTLSVDPGTTPMKIAMLIDNSEPMRPGISSLRNGVAGFLNTLPPQHEIGMYSIAGSVLPIVDFTTDRDELRDGADGLFPGTGGAKMIAGLRETWERRFEGDEAWPVLFLLLTDGPETSGNMNPDQFNAFIMELVGKGVTVHALLLETRGGGIQTQISQILTKNSGGLYRSINSATAMVDELASMATQMGEHFDAMSDRYRIVYERPGDTPGAQIGAGIVGPNYKMQLSMDRRMPQP